QLQRRRRPAVWGVGCSTFGRYGALDWAASVGLGLVFSVLVSPPPLGILPPVRPPRPFAGHMLALPADILPFIGMFRVAVCLCPQRLPEDFEIGRTTSLRSPVVGRRADRRRSGLSTASGAMRSEGHRTGSRRHGDLAVICERSPCVWWARLDGHHPD